MDIKERFSGMISEYSLLKKGDSVLVALSGGPDSVALLHLLLDIRDEYRLTIAAAHLDHGIRASSSEDRGFCRKLCRESGIRFHSRRIDVVGLAGSKRMNLEEAGRKSRYDYFNSLCLRFGYTKTATGHTMDDNAETVLFNLTRGSGSRGLGGIAPRRGKIIRPLLEIRKIEIIKWLKENKISYRTDPTNRSLRFSRNRIRRLVLPELEKINPEVVRSISRLSRIISEEIESNEKSSVILYEKALVTEGKSKIVLDLRKLRGYDNGLVKRVVTEAFYRLRGKRESPSFDLLSRLNVTIGGRSGIKSPLGKDIWIEKSQGLVSVSKADSGGIREMRISLAVPGITPIAGTGCTMKTRILRRSALRTLKTKPSVALLDNGKISGPEIRFRNKGDRMRPLGMRGTRLLSDLLIDRKIASFERDRIPLVVSGGRIAWLAGVIISEDFKVTEETHEVLRIELCGP